MSASVDSKPLRQSLSPLDATLTKNRGRGRGSKVAVSGEFPQPSFPSRAPDPNLMSRITEHGSRNTVHFFNGGAG